MIEQIDAALFCEHPWPHLEFAEFLPAADAQHIAQHWPTDGYSWLRHSDIVKDDGTSLRKYQPLCIAFPEIAARVTSEAVQEVFKQRLGVEADLYPFALLIEDLPGYRIRLHTDCAGKVISTQCYLAEDSTHAEQGVILEGGGWTRQLPYLANHGYAFKVTRSSWHRVNKSAARRRSLQLIYYDTPTPKL